MIAGRVVYGIVISIATYIFGIPLGGIPAVIAATTTGIPGIIIQLIFVPTIVMAIVKGGYFDEVAATAKKLNEEGLSLISWYEQGEIYTSKLHGIGPIINPMKEDIYYFEDAIVVDKVIGKATAMLLILSKVNTFMPMSKWKSPSKYWNIIISVMIVKKLFLYYQ